MAHCDHGVSSNKKKEDEDVELARGEERGHDGNAENTRIGIVLPTKNYQTACNYIGNLKKGIKVYFICFAISASDWRRTS